MARPALRPPAPRPSARGRLVWLAVGLALVGAAAWWLFLRESPPDLRRLANLDAPGETVVFLGDSITKGYGLSEAEAFPALVAAALGVPHLNAGVSGDTTATGLARLDTDVLVHQPRLTVVELGGNDYLRRVPAAVTLGNLDAIVTRLIDAGGMVAILHVSVGIAGDPLLQGLREMAARRGALFVPDILRGILSDPALKLDPIHPNARGQRRIADRVAERLRPLLDEADRRRGAGR